VKCSIHPEARRELLEAIDYYNDIEPGLGASFLAEIESAISLVEEHPALWVEIASGIRRCLVRRFPYAVLYSAEAGRIFILAFMHTRRKPGYWSSRRQRN
jgi:plasmid stabilization system protein ParE